MKSFSSWVSLYGQVKDGLSVRYPSDLEHLRSLEHLFLQRGSVARTSVTAITVPTTK